MTITVEAAVTPATDFALNSLYGGEQESWGNQSVAVGTDGRIYFTTYLADDTVGEVVVLNADGTYATTVSIADVVGYPFASAYDVIVGADGRVFVSSEVADSLEDLNAEAGRGVIVVIDPDDDYATALFAELADPASALAFDGTGRLYVANWNNDNITVLNVDGSVHRVIQSEPLFEDDDSGVAGMAISGSGLLYLTKPGLGAIKVVNQNGTTADVFEVGGAPWAIAVNAVGHLFVSDFGSSSVVELDQAGAVVRSIALAQDVQASDVTVAEDGTVYVPYLGSSGASIAIITAVSGPDSSHHGPQIPGTPGAVGQSTLTVGNTVYQSTFGTDPGTGLPTTILTLVRHDGTSAFVRATGQAYGDITAGPDGVVYQTLTYTDQADGDPRTGVLAIAIDGVGYFTGLYDGNPIGPVVASEDTTYQIIYRHDDETSAYTTTVLAIVNGVAFDYDVSGIPGGPLSGASNVVIAPDGTVYLTVTNISSDSVDYSSATTSIVVLRADGLTSYTTAGFAGGPVAITPDGKVYQSLGLAEIDAETGDTTFTAAIAVLGETGLITRPHTVSGFPIGGVVVRPDGSAFLTVLAFQDSEDLQAGFPTTLLATVTSTGLASLIDPAPGVPADVDGSWLPAVVGADGVVYLTTNVSDSESGSSTTIVTVVQPEGDIQVWTVAGQPVGNVGFGVAGTGYQTTYDPTTDTTRITVITATGSSVHVLAGYPGNADITSKPAGAAIGADGNAYLTVSSKDSVTGQYNSVVAIVSPDGVISWSFTGVPSGSVHFDAAGVAHQVITDFDFAGQRRVTAVYTVAPNGASQVGDPLLGLPGGGVVFGADGTVYIGLSQQHGTGSTTVHAVNTSATNLLVAQRDTLVQLRAAATESTRSSLAASSTIPYLRVIDSAYLRPFNQADPTGRFTFTAHINSLRGLSVDLTPINKAYADQLAAAMQQSYSSTGFTRDTQGRLIYRNNYAQDVLVVYGPRSDNLAPVGAILVRPGQTEFLPASEDGRFAASQRIGQNDWDAFVYRGSTPVQETKAKSNTFSTGNSQQHTVSELLPNISTTPDTIRIDKTVSNDVTRVVVYISGVKSFEFKNAGSYNAVLRAKQGYIDENMNDTINKAIEDIEKDGEYVSEIMLVGFSKGGMTAQNYAAKDKGKYSSRVTTVITYASPLVKKAGEYGSIVNVLHLVAKNDYMPRDEAFGGVRVFADGDWHTQASNRGVRDSFVNDSGDWKTSYTVDTGTTYSTNDDTRHGRDNYAAVARDYDANAHRWEQSRRIVNDINRFLSGTVTNIVNYKSF